MKELASHIMDIVQNSVRAQADCIEIEVSESTKIDRLTIEIRDNGCGMDENTLAKVYDPFYTSRTVRKVGLGIPLLQQNAEQTGGGITINSALGKGTTLTAFFTLSHLDRPPMGNVAETLSLLFATNPGIHFVYRHTTEQGCYELNTEVLKEVLDGIPFSNPDILSGLQCMIYENLKEIRADN